MHSKALVAVAVATLMVHVHAESPMASIASQASVAPLVMPAEIEQMLEDRPIEMQHYRDHEDKKDGGKEHRWEDDKKFDDDDDDEEDDDDEKHHHHHGNKGHKHQDEDVKEASIKHIKNTNTDEVEEELPRGGVQLKSIRPASAHAKAEADDAKGEEKSELKESDELAEVGDVAEPAEGGEAAEPKEGEEATEPPKEDEEVAEPEAPAADEPVGAAEDLKVSKSASASASMAVSSKLTVPTTGLSLSFGTGPSASVAAPASMSASGSGTMKPSAGMAKVQKSSAHFLKVSIGATVGAAIIGAFFSLL